MATERFRPFYTDSPSVAHLLKIIQESRSRKTLLKDLADAEPVEPATHEHFGTPCGHEDYPCCGCSDEYNQRVG